MAARGQQLIKKLKGILEKRMFFSFVLETI